MVEVHHAFLPIFMRVFGYSFGPRFPRSLDTFAYEQFWELDHLVFNPQLETHMLTSLISRSKVGISGL